jgi:DNA-binding CsgD family transcriptional regulator
VITAPAGYGKTMLATEWLQGRERVVWYRATSASADVAAFSAGLADVMAELLPGIGEQLKQRLRVSDTPERAARPLAELLSEDLADWPAEALLVIDDYHLVADSAPVEDFFDWLLTLAPQLRVLATSRRRPRWASARRILYGEITEIGRDQLAMNADEAARVLGDDRSSESVRALVTQAEGWPALIGLAALTASREIPTERVSEALYRYFAEEVVRREAPEVERFMLLASVPATVDTRVAREVLGLPDSQAVLEQLVEDGLLNSTADQFRFHPLLRSFLVARLQGSEPELHRELSLRAIEDARAESRWEEAFELAVEIDRRDLAAQIIELATSELLAVGKIELLERWLDECGTFSIDLPGAVLARSEVFTRQGRLKEAAATAARVASRLGPDDALASRAEYLAGRAYHLMSKEADALECHLRARASAHEPQDLSNALWGGYLAAGELGLDIAVTYLNELEALDLQDSAFRFRVATGQMAWAANGGSLKGVSEIFESLLPAVEHVSDPMVQTSFLTRTAEIEVLRARYESARKLASRALDLSDALHLVFARPLCLVGLIAADIGLRQFTSARENLFALSTHSSSTGDPYLDLCARNLELKLRASEARASPMPKLNEELDLGVHTACRGEHFALRALWMATHGDPTIATLLAGRARDISAGAEATYFSQFAELIVARKLGGDEDSVLHTADELVKSAAEHEVLDAIVLACRADPELTRLFGGLPVAGQIVARTLLASGDRALLKRSGLLAEASRASRAEAVLTPREMQVLELLGRGYSNAGIAAELVISLSTAKVHVHHVLKKLGVETRLQAALRAEEINSG